MNEQICLNIDKERKRRAIQLLRQRYPNETLERVLWMTIIEAAENDGEYFETPMKHYFKLLQTT